jgi:hypothetical protein
MARRRSNGRGSRGAQREPEHGHLLKFQPVERLDNRFFPDGALGDDTLIEVIQMISGGMSDGEFMRGYQVDLRCGGHYGPYRLDVRDFLQNLGRSGIIKVRGRSEYLTLPPPFIAMLLFERIRMDALAMLRNRLGPPEQFETSFADPTRAPAPGVYSLTGLQQPVEYLLLLDVGDAICGGDTAHAIQHLAAVIVAVNLLVVWIRTRFNLPAPDPESWMRGRAVESALFETRLPPRSEWARSVQDAFTLFHVPMPTIGQFVLPGTGDGDARAPRTGEERPARQGPRWEPERLLYYMGLPQYVEPRALEGIGGRFGYIAVCFTDDRVGLDTALTANRFFGLQGPLVECLSVAPLTKTAIRAHPLCKLPVVHDAHGTWRETIRRWVSGEMG